jgi:hypothetical protein
MCKPDSFYKMQSLFNAGGMLKARYGITSDLADLNRSIKYLEQAVALLSPKTKHVQVVYRKMLAEALQERFERTENLADLKRAKQLLRSV